jgi:hypothetical protein
MGAIASHEAQRLSFEHAPNPKRDPGAYGALGLLIAYIVVLRFGIVANLPIEKFEATMNVAAIAGLAVLCAAFWQSSRQNVTDAENNHLRGDLGRSAVSAVDDLRMMSKKAGSPPGERWGPTSIIGFPDE